MTTRSTYTKTFSLLGVLVGAGAGALAMFLLDPQSGRRRRALVTDKGNSFARRGVKAVNAKSRDLRNRFQGLLAQTGAMGVSYTESDAVENRVH